MDSDAALWQCLSHAERANNKDFARWSVGLLAGRLSRKGENWTALTLLERFLKLERHPDTLLVAGLVLTRLSRWKSARKFYHEALDSPLVTESLSAVLKSNLAAIDYREGNRAMAKIGFESALAFHQKVGSQQDEAIALHNLAMIDLDESRPDLAENKLKNALAIFKASNDIEHQTLVVSSLGILEFEKGNLISARELLTNILEDW